MTSRLRAAVATFFAVFAIALAAVPVAVAAAPDCVSPCRF